MCYCSMPVLFISTPIVADWLLYYSIQNFKQFFPFLFEISMMQRALFPLGWTPLNSINIMVIKG